jgi:carbonic anhydrase
MQGDVDVKNCERMTKHADQYRESKSGNDRRVGMANVLTGDEAVARLREGNRRFVKGLSTHPDQGMDRCFEVCKGQSPFVAILGCSDSRVPLEIIFDQGIGDLFVVRVAGNVTDDMVSASIEYAAEHLHVPLVVVLGHQYCGAIQAAMQGGEVPGHLPSLMQALQPALERGRAQGGNDPVEQAVRANIELTTNALRNSRLLSQIVNQGTLKVVGAYYSLETGRVDFL